MQRFITLALFLAAVNALLAIAGLFFPLASLQALAWALADFLRKQNVETACCLIVGLQGMSFPAFGWVGLGIAVAALMLAWKTQ